MRRTLWKKEQARIALDEIAQDVAEFFGIAKPLVYIPEGCTGWEWEYRFDTVEVWTKAGRAELNVRIDAAFAHMYFCFDDPARAVCFDNGMSRLNRHSGKWNAISTPESWARHGKPDAQDSVDMFRAELRRDFRKVAEKNPPADEVGEYRAKEAARQAQWAEYLQTLQS